MMNGSISLVERRYKTAMNIEGPLLTVGRLQGAAYGELVEIFDQEGQPRQGQILEMKKDEAVIQVFGGTQGLSLADTELRLTGQLARLEVSPQMIGRTFNGAGRLIDGGPPFIAEETLNIIGHPLNPVARSYPSAFIETGISAIDGLATLVRGQKLPIFTGSGLPAHELACRIAAKARVPNDDTPFVVIFAAIGVTDREAGYFTDNFEASEAKERTIFFLNRADEPAVERLLTPRMALTAGEFLAFERGMHVLVLLTDMSNYADALREVANAREEIPGRRGYPGYLYTDLASLYERAGCVKGRAGSLTQIMILTMPDDDITHPIPDLTGYITEGQIILSRELHKKGIFPPIDPLPSLSRLMNAGIGPGKTREDHRDVAAQLYALYAAGRDLRRLVAVVGEGALAPEDKIKLRFADKFEKDFLNQGQISRSIDETLGRAWDLFKDLSPTDLRRIKPEFRARYGGSGEGEVKS